MKDTERTRRNTQVLIEAERTFKDALNYTDKQLICYMRLINGIREPEQKIEKDSMLASGIYNALKSMGDEEVQILMLRLGEGHTVRAICTFFNIAHDTLKRIEKRALKKVSDNYHHISVKEYNKLLEQKRQFIESIKPCDYTSCSLPIEDLNLSKTTYNCLKRARINTVSQLLICSEESLLGIYGFGTKCLEEVACKVQDIVPEWRPRKQWNSTYSYYMTRLSNDGVVSDKMLLEIPIEVLEFSTRTFNGLKRSGIVTIGDLVKVTNKELRNIPNLGKKCISEINEKKESMKFLW